jgi:5-methylcytosine-specific restriction protein A
MVTPKKTEPSRIRGRALQARRARLWSANPCCAHCQRLTEFPSGFELDHIVSLYKDGDDTDENCQVLCHECHELKTQSDMGYTERTTFDDNGNVVW